MIATATLASPIPGVLGPLVIETEHCKGCGLCVDVCPVTVLALDTDTVNGSGHHPVQLLDATRCTSCSFCARVCPDAVFTVFAKPRGTTR